MGSLGEPRNTHNLHDIIFPGGKPAKPDEAIKPDKVNELAIRKQLHKDSQRKQPDEVGKVDEPEDLDELIPFALRITRRQVNRLYSEKFHDPGQRPIQDVVGEILQAGLDSRPDKGPAPDAFIAMYKSMGKRKKS